MEKFKILDLFSGAGGFSYGLDSLPYFETLVAVDFDKHALETFKFNFPKARCVLGDICKPDTKKELLEISKKIGINMIIGGPPCQGFSLKGKNLGLDDPRNFLFLEFLDIVEDLLPKIVIIENVKNMIKSSNGYFIDQIISKLKKNGYKCDYGVLNAHDFGVPQNRERAIIIAHKGDKLITLPKPPKNSLKLTVRDAISDLSYLNSGEGLFVSQYLSQPLSDYQKNMRKDSVQLYNHIATSHSKVAIEKLSFIPPEGSKKYLPKEFHGNQKFGTTWSRLEWDKPSPTIDTRFDTPSNGKNSHPFLNRSITPREAARIQGFPDRFIFKGPKTSVCRQIGNAVPPALSRNIGKHIISELQDD
ncbi:DNA cytosine methyltransferase [Mycoplasma simbae]|uniref:DNA cytosine methyltransferase n=1 Tax=Mycoplasma simbae TaxID=36744 RepID=UPI000494EEDB|nr:DNA cytosine methyltransferase [Mycoplasma simbae]